MDKSESTIEKYEILVLGSGEAGKYIAWNLGSAGKKTALIERRYIGGSCPNIACLPSKNMVHSAKVAHLASQAAAYGLHPAERGVEMPVVRGRKRAMVDGLIEGYKDRFARSGVDLVMGEGRFVAPKTIEVQLNGGGVRTVAGEHVVISTGSRATIDPIPGLADATPLTHVEALELGVVPGHLIILGGGYVGLEFAQAMRRFGSQVTIIERNDRLLHREDVEVSAAVAKILSAEGIGIVTRARLREVRGHSGEQVTMNFERDDNVLEVEGTHLLVATGRTPNTDDMGLTETGVARTPQGFVQVNERLETSASGVFAVGDCAGSPHFTHIAFDDHRIVCAAITGGHRTTKGRLVPSCLFIDPEFARIGLNEAEAKRSRIPYRLVTLPMKAVPRTRTTGEAEGFLKALISAKDDTIIGFSALGDSAGEMMAPVQLAMSTGLPYTALRDSIFTHPTFAEGLVFLFSAKPTSVDS